MFLVTTRKNCPSFLSGIFVSTSSAFSEAAINLVADCAFADYQDQCDSNVSHNATNIGYVVDGICGGSSNDACFTQWAIDANNDASSPTSNGAEARAIS